MTYLIYNYALCTFLRCMVYFFVSLNHINVKQYLNLHSCDLLVVLALFLDVLAKIVFFPAYWQK